MKGWGPNSSICPSKLGKSNFFGVGYPGIFAGMSRWRPKSLRGKTYVCVQFLALPLLIAQKTLERKGFLCNPARPLQESPGPSGSVDANGVLIMCDLCS